ncbi:MAG: RodZ domain-containing protein [Pseudomonadota bacterium]
MTNQFEFSGDDKSEARRRLHLKDITTELPDQGDDTAGSELRAARERRGEDLRAIALSLRIRREQLEALEESRYDDLPGRAYAVGFVRSYAEYLGLDSMAIVERYKSELDGCFADKMPVAAFPETREPTRLPRGTFLIIALIIGVGIYGGYLMTRSADQLMASRLPAQPDKVEAKLANPQEPDERPVGLSGDPASAATRPASDATAQQLLGDGAPTEPSSVYAVPLVTAPPAEVAAPADAAAVPAPAISEVAALAPSAAGSGLPAIPQGAVYGAENTDARVTIRARKPDAWVRIEDAQGHVLIERTLKVGDTYAVPNVPGVILVARDASAFELVVDQQSLGLAGPPTLVLTGKPLDPAALIAAMPKVAPTPAEEAAALAPTPVIPAVAPDSVTR